MASAVSVVTNTSGNMVSFELYWNDIPKLKHIGIDILRNNNFYLVVLYEVKGEYTEIITSIDFTTEEEAREYIRKALHFYAESDKDIDKIVSLLRVTTKIDKTKLPKYPTILNTKPSK